MTKKSAETSSGVYEYVFEKKDLDEGLRVIQERSDGKCIVDTRDMGNRVKVTVILFSDTPEGKAQDILSDLKNAKVEVHSYQAGSAEKEIEF